MLWKDTRKQGVESHTDELTSEGEWVSEESQGSGWSTPLLEDKQQLGVSGKGTEKEKSQEEAINEKTCVIERLRRELRKSVD